MYNQHETNHLPKPTQWITPAPISQVPGAALAGRLNGARNPGADHEGFPGGEI